MSELQGMTVVAGYFAVLWVAWFLLWCRELTKSQQLRDDITDLRERAEAWLDEIDDLRDA